MILKSPHRRFSGYAVGQQRLSLLEDVSSSFDIKGSSELQARGVRVRLAAAKRDGVVLTTSRLESPGSNSLSSHGRTTFTLHTYTSISILLHIHG